MRRSIFYFSSDSFSRLLPTVHLTQDRHDIQCDRVKPCSACCLRGTPSECEYGTSKQDRHFIHQSTLIENLLHSCRTLKQQLDEARRLANLPPIKDSVVPSPLNLIGTGENTSSAESNPPDSNSPTATVDGTESRRPADTASQRPKSQGSSPEAEVVALVKAVRSDHDRSVREFGKCRAQGSQNDRDRQSVRDGSRLLTPSPSLHLRRRVVPAPSPRVGDPFSRTVDRPVAGRIQSGRPSEWWHPRRTALGGGHAGHVPDAHQGLRGRLPDPCGPAGPEHGHGTGRALAIHQRSEPAAASAARPRTEQENRYPGGGPALHDHRGEPPIWSWPWCDKQQI